MHTSKHWIVFLVLLFVCPFTFAADDVTLTWSSQSTTTDFSVVASAPASVCSAEPVSGELIITNLGNVPSAYSLSVDQSWVEYAPTRFLLQVGEEKRVGYYIRTPYALQGSQTFTFTVVDNTGKTKQVTNSVLVTQCENIALETTATSVTSCPCTVLPLAFTLTNTNGFTETYDLGFANIDSASYVLSEKAVVLRSQEQKQIYAYIKEPCSVYGDFVKEFKATARTSKLQAVLPIEMHIEQACYTYGVALSELFDITNQTQAVVSFVQPEDYEYTICEGTQGTILAQLTNLGNTINVYTLSIEDATSWISSPAQAVALDPNGQTLTQLYVTPPQGSAGNYSFAFKAASVRGDLLSVLPFSVNVVDCDGEVARAGIARILWIALLILVLLVLLLLLAYLENEYGEGKILGFFRGTKGKGTVASEHSKKAKKSAKDTDSSKLPSWFWIVPLIAALIILFIIGAILYAKQKDQTPDTLFGNQTLNETTLPGNLSNQTGNVTLEPASSGVAPAFAKVLPWIGKFLLLLLLLGILALLVYLFVKKGLPFIKKKYQAYKKRREQKARIAEREAALLAKKEAKSAREIAAKKAKEMSDAEEARKKKEAEAAALAALAKQEKDDEVPKPKKSFWGFLIPLLCLLLLIAGVIGIVLFMNNEQPSEELANETLENETDTEEPELVTDVSEPQGAQGLDEEQLRALILEILRNETSGNISDLETQIDALAENMSALEELRAEKENEQIDRILDLEENLSRITSDLEEKEEQISALEDALAVTLQIVREGDNVSLAEIAALEEQLNALRADVSALEDAKEDHERRITALEERVDNLEDAVSEISDFIAGIVARLSDMEARTEQKIKDAVSDLTDKITNTIDDIQDQVDDLEETQDIILTEQGVTDDDELPKPYLTVLVVDTSTSTLIVENGSRRFERVIEHAQSYVSRSRDQEYTLITIGKNPNIIVRNVRGVYVARALDLLSPTEDQSYIALSMRKASSVLGERMGRIVVVSDFESTDYIDINKVKEEITRKGQVIIFDDIRQLSEEETEPTPETETAPLPGEETSEEEPAISTETGQGTVEEDLYAPLTLDLYKNSEYVFNLSDYFVDSDFDPLTYTREASPELTVTLKDSLAQISPQENWTGEGWVQFTADDGKGGIVQSGKIRVLVHETRAPEEETPEEENSLYTKVLPVIGVVIGIMILLALLFSGKKTNKIDLEIEEIVKKK